MRLFPASVCAPALVVFVGCTPGFDDFIFEPPLAGGGTVSAAKELALTIGAEPVRFVLPVRVSPASFDATVTAVVEQASRPLRLELTPEQFAGSPPEVWPLVETGTEVFIFSTGTSPERLFVTLARDPTDIDDPIAVRLRLRLTAPTDIDFDGLDDDVTVNLDELEPAPADFP
jgi:hypothetical protein